MTLGEISQSEEACLEEHCGTSLWHSKVSRLFKESIN